MMISSKDIVTKKSCCFAGHSQISEDNDIIKNQIKETLRSIAQTADIVYCYVGNYGDFDNIVATAIYELKEECNKFRAYLVIPYLNKAENKIGNSKLKWFDEVFIPNIPLNTPPRLKIIKTNQYMVDKSDYLICYIKYSFGGAAKTFDYAKRKKIEIINLANSLGKS